jgi:hypothetical protein
VAKVRAAPAGEIGASDIRTAYGQLFGGNQVLNEAGYRLILPASMDAARVQRGLANILATRLEGATPAQHQDALRGTWVDAGPDRLVFYPLGSPTPLAARDGHPLVTTPAEALAAPMPPPAVQRAVERGRRQEYFQRTTGAPRAPIRPAGMAAPSE